MQIRSLHHVSFTVEDIEKTQEFAQDFGLLTVEKSDDHVVMRTGGGDAWCYKAVRGERGFTGLGFLVENKSDLEEAVKEHGASPIKELDTPGGGFGVTLDGPEGLKVELVYGIEGDTPVEVQPELRTNTPANRVRFSVPQETRPLGPANLYRLGHLGLYVKNYKTASEWFGRVLGMKCSDSMHVPGMPHVTVVGFWRIDRGEKFVDHHSIFFAEDEHDKKTDLHHISFEAQDYEAQFRAHRWLLSQGHELNWGVGRHPLGCHVFDVWFAPDRYRFETFTDTDLLNHDHVTGHHDISQHEMDCWSDEPPEKYFM